MPKREYLFIALAVGHLSLVVLGMAKMELLPISSLPGQWLRIYTGVSGADKSYGFFAPGVRHQERATFTLTDAQGRQWTDDLEFGGSSEANLRLGSTANVLRAVDDETAFHFMRSMADMMLRRHPTAKTATVQIQAYGIQIPRPDGQGPPLVDFPTMDEFRDGKKPAWIDLYSLTFQTDKFGQTVAVDQIQQASL